MLIEKLFKSHFYKENHCDELMAFISLHYSFENGKNVPWNPDVIKCGAISMWYKSVSLYIFIVVVIVDARLRKDIEREWDKKQCWENFYFLHRMAWIVRRFWTEKKRTPSVVVLAKISQFIIMDMGSICRAKNVMKKKNTSCGQLQADNED